MSESAPQVALVTGSATGIGRACALRFAQNKFDVVVNLCYIYYIMKRLMIQKHAVACYMLSTWRKPMGKGVC